MKTQKKYQQSASRTYFPSDFDILQRYFNEQHKQDIKEEDNFGKYEKGSIDYEFIGYLEKFSKLSLEELRSYWSSIYTIHTGPFQYENGAKLKDNKIESFYRHDSCRVVDFCVACHQGARSHKNSVMGKRMKDINVSQAESYPFVEHDWEVRNYYRKIRKARKRPGYAVFY